MTIMFIYIVFIHHICSLIHLISSVLWRTDTDQVTSFLYNHMSIIISNKNKEYLLYKYEKRPMISYNNRLINMDKESQLG